MRPRESWSRARLANLVVVWVILGVACGGSTSRQSADGTAPVVSGRLEAGLRVLTFDPAAGDQHFTVYRGDYVRPELAGGGAFNLEIPRLDLARSFPGATGEQPYFKVPDAGVFEFRVGEGGGVIEAIEYAAPQYHEVGAREAALMIGNVKPLILDVRTEREFASGHLADAVLIPVQGLQRRIGELEAHKHGTVLIYCATGNRSTVAAKLLVDAGFKNVVNMRRGVAEWTWEGLPLVK